MEFPQDFKNYHHQPPLNLSIAGNSLRDSPSLHSTSHKSPWGTCSIRRREITTIEVIFSMFQIQYKECLEAGSIHDHWKNHSLDYMDLCWQSNVSAFEYAI